MANCKCVVYGCSSSSYNHKYCKLKFHIFPINRKLQRIWKEACKNARIMRVYHKSLYMCSLHFGDSCYTNNKGKLRLKKNSVPTLNLPISGLDVYETPGKEVPKKKRRETKSGNPQSAKRKIPVNAVYNIMLEAKRDYSRLRTEPLIGPGGQFRKGSLETGESSKQLNQQRDSKCDSSRDSFVNDAAISSGSSELPIKVEDDNTSEVKEEINTYLIEIEDEDKESEADSDSVHEIETTATVSRTDGPVLVSSTEVDDQPPPKKICRTQNIQNVDSAEDQEEEEDDCSTFAAHLKTRMKRFDPQQKIIAQKLISDIMFMADCKQLQIQSVVMNPLHFNNQSGSFN